MQFGPDLVLNRFVRHARGVSAVEFALCLPVLMLLYLGGYIVSDMISCSRKVTTSTRTVVDLVSRAMSPTVVYNAPQNASATSYLSASAVLLSPRNLGNATEQVSLLRVCDAGHAYVVWTQAQTQSSDGSTVAPTTSTQTAGTLPASQAQPASSVVSIPSSMVTLPMIPVSPDLSDVCGNLNPSTVLKTQVGTAGGWLYMGIVKYSYSPPVRFGSLGSMNLKDTLYMVPRLY